MFEYLSSDHRQSKYYYHGCGTCETLSKILDSKKICTRKDLGLELKGGNGLFNGLEYISVCKKSYKKDNEQEINGTVESFTSFICRGFGLILSDDIRAEKTEIFKFDRYFTPYDIYKFVSEHSEKRWSNMFDEYQVKGSIDIDKFKAVMLPIDRLEKGYIKFDSKYLSNIMNKIDKYNLDIVNSCDDRFSELYESPDYNRDEQNSKIKKRVMKIIN